MRTNLLLIGAGGHCRSVIDVIESSQQYHIVGILDVPEKVGQVVLGYDVIGTNQDMPTLIKQTPNVVITVGQIHSPAVRIKLYDLAKECGAAFPVILSPHAYVSRHASIDEGTVVMHHAMVNAGAVVGKNCILNTRACLEHDSVIGDHCHLSTGVIVNGGVTVGARTFIGSGSVTKEGITLPSDSFIKAQSLVRGPI